MKQKKQIFNSTLLLLAAFIIIANSCKTEVPIILPTVNTNLEITNITATTAMSGGIITNDNGETVTSRGVCWSTAINPTIKDSLTKDGSGAGAFASNLKNLSPNTSYYLRAYATNKFGTVYGNAMSFTTQQVGGGATFVNIPAGTFTMGSPTSEVNRESDETQYQVTLSAFRMSKYEITNAQYAAFLNAKSIGSNGIWAAGAYPTQT
ncbi:MAG: SUMF1/EgtB/PvdO family nonheme iron enzyme, partial [Paludibacter sp.]|nr:SUMF1/EgtB/PvdO family nonheme iron enzyme [Paludibacter sp.]